MTIRTILVPLLADEGDKRSLAAAGRIARQFQAHVTALYVEPDADDIYVAMASVGGGAYLSEEIIESIKRQGEERRRSAEQNFAAWKEAAAMPVRATTAGEPSCSTQFVTKVGTLEAVIKDYALVADLVVATPAGRGEMERRLTTEVALIDARRPVILVPAAREWPDAISRAAIAWNGSAEAARAATAALPLLQGLAQVTILHAGQPDQTGSSQRMATYLAWHGITATCRELGTADEPSVLIARELAASGTELLVMGAYTHSRVRELVFGGVTRDMLDVAPTAILLAH